MQEQILLHPFQNPNIFLSLQRNWQGTREPGSPGAFASVVLQLVSFMCWRDGKMSASNPQALVVQMYRPCGHVPSVMSLLHSLSRLPELAPVLLASGKANSFPFFMHMRCALDLFYSFC